LAEAFLAGAFFFVATQLTSFHGSVIRFTVLPDPTLLLLLRRLLGSLLLRHGSYHLLSRHRSPETLIDLIRFYFFFFAAFLGAFFFVMDRITSFHARVAPQVTTAPAGDS
jgi:hypothetical protein